MSVFFEELDVDAELQTLEDTPPQAGDKIRWFSHFRWEQERNLQNDASHQSLTIPAAEHFREGERNPDSMKCGR